MNLPTTLVSTAQLPALYENAKTALAECSRIDECQQWADKAAAMASYAKQSKDETLHRYADRIKARAITRCGELLKAIPAAHGANQNIQAGALPIVTREQAATDAGLSEHQRKTALRVASVDPEVREALIESDNPPTITELAHMGTKPRNIIDLGGRDPKDFAMATTTIGTARSYAEYIKSIDPAKIVGAILPHEVASLRRNIAIIDAYHDYLVVHMEG